MASEPKSDAEWLALARKHKFRIGQRVRLSAHGREQRLLPRIRIDAGGFVTKVDESNRPTVRWDHRRTADSYFPGFIQPDRRRNHQ